MHDYLMLCGERNLRTGRAWSKGVMPPKLRAARGVLLGPAIAKGDNVHAHPWLYQELKKYGFSGY